MCAMLGWFSDASVWASRVKPGEPIGVAREEIRQHFNRDVAIQFRIAGAIDLAHAAGPEG